MLAEWSLKIERKKRIWSQEIKEKKTTATPNKSSWTILLSAFGHEKGGFSSNLNCHRGCSVLNKFLESVSQLSWPWLFDLTLAIL